MLAHTYTQVWADGTGRHMKPNSDSLPCGGTPQGTHTYMDTHTGTHTGHHTHAWACSLPAHMHRQSHLEQEPGVGGLLLSSLPWAPQDLRGHQ